MSTIVHLAVLALAILALSRLYPGVRIKTNGTAVAVAVVFSVLNLLLGWLIRAVLFVPAVLTLGLLFLFVPFIVNAVLLWVTDKVMASFEIKTLRALLVSAAVITLINGAFHLQLFQSVWHGFGAGPHAGYGHPRWI